MLRFRRVLQSVRPCPVLLEAQPLYDMSSPQERGSNAHLMFPYTVSLPTLQLSVSQQSYVASKSYKFAGFWGQLASCSWASAVVTQGSLSWISRPRAPQAIIRDGIDWNPSRRGLRNVAKCHASDTGWINLLQQVRQDQRGRSSFSLYKYKGKRHLHP